MLNSVTAKNARAAMTKAMVISMASANPFDYSCIILANSHIHTSDRINPSS